MKRSVETPLTSEGGIVKTVFDFPVAVPSLIR